MCALATGIADARTLHVGNKSFALSQTKYTTPSLAFAVPNEATWYCPLTTTVISNTLHVKTPRQEYYVDAPDDYAAHIAETCPEIFTDTENYTYDNDGRLIGADENLYLKSTRTQYINTNYVPNSFTRAELHAKFNGTFDTNAYSMFHGHYPDNQVPDFTFANSFATKITGRIMFWLTSWGYQNHEGGAINISVADINTKGHIVLDAKNRSGKYNNENINNLKRVSTSTEYPYLLFGASRKSGNFAFGCYDMILYDSKLYEDDVLMHHFVPVPACMRIGDFIVPENGMWDIVEQKFYGNSGTGSFIYGKDE